MSTPNTRGGDTSPCKMLAIVRGAVAETDAAAAHLAMVRRLERKRLETFVRLNPTLSVAEVSRLVGRSRPTIDKVVKGIYR